MSLAGAIGRVADRLRAEVQHQAVVIEGTRGTYVDRGTDTASGDVGTAGLVHLERADGFRREVGEVERAAWARGRR